MAQFYDAYTHPFWIDFADGEENNDEDMCDSTGYQPFEDQINDLLASGQNLVNYFDQRYPGNDEEDPEFTNEQPFPTPSDYMEAFDRLRSEYNILRSKLIKKEESQIKDSDVEKAAQNSNQMENTTSLPPTSSDKS